MKKWYTVTFSAKMTEEDVRAMKNCFYQAMEEAMEISPCANLDITLEDEFNGIDKDFEEMITGVNNDDCESI